jgi:hypothetical protein
MLYPQLAFMPTLVLASSLCPPGIEGTLFASLMSIYNAASYLSVSSGGLLTQLLHVTESNFDNLSLLLFICAALGATPLLFLYLLSPAPDAPAAAADSATAVADSPE